ncbi:MAG: hypothetical protein GY862_25375 [Gammaproteobacteria bacterium]|nr:hypothetical protein [Gammaproteobacteria bacterium]
MNCNMADIVGLIAELKGQAEAIVFSDKPDISIRLGPDDTLQRTGEDALNVAAGMLIAVRGIEIKMGLLDD